MATIVSALMTAIIRSGARCLKDQIKVIVVEQEAHGEDELEDVSKIEVKMRKLGLLRRAGALVRCQHAIASLG